MIRCFNSTKAANIKAGDTITFDGPNTDVTIEDVSVMDCGWIRLTANNDTYSLSLKPTDTIRVLEKNTGTVIKVEVKSVYGCLKAYPTNEAARTLAQIAGTKTLASETLALAERLGMVIEQVQTNQLKAIA